MAALPKACKTMPELVVGTATACKLPPEAKWQPHVSHSASARQTAGKPNARFLDAEDGSGLFALES